MSFKRNCSKCNGFIRYKTKSALNKATRSDSKCRRCFQIGRIPWNAGKRGIYSEDTLKKMSSIKLRDDNPLRGKKNPKQSEWLTKNHPMRGKHFTQKTKTKMRIAAVNRIQRDGTSRIGRHEKQILDEQEKKDGVKILRQWNTGIGYVVDGYCPETNTVYEVYEKYHSRLLQRIRDRKRKRRIINYSKCKFVIIWEK